MLDVIFEKIREEGGVIGDRRLQERQPCDIKTAVGLAGSGRNSFALTKIIWSSFLATIARFLAHELRVALPRSERHFSIRLSGSGERDPERKDLRRIRSEHVDWTGDQRESLRSHAAKRDFSC